MKHSLVKPIIISLCSTLVLSLMACAGSGDRYMSPSTYGVKGQGDAKAINNPANNDNQDAIDQQQGGNGQSNDGANKSGDGTDGGANKSGDGTDAGSMDKTKTGSDGKDMPPSGDMPKTPPPPPPVEPKKEEPPKMASLIIKIKEEAVIKKCGSLPKLTYKYSYQGKTGEGEISYKDKYAQAEIKDLMANKKDNFLVEVYQGKDIKFSVKFDGLMLAEGESAIEVADLK